jgi:hypothetical protein
VLESNLLSLGQIYGHNLLRKSNLCMPEPDSCSLQIGMASNQKYVLTVYHAKDEICMACVLTGFDLHKKGLSQAPHWYRHPI